MIIVKKHRTIETETTKDMLRPPFLLADNAPFLDFLSAEVPLFVPKLLESLPSLVTGRPGDGFRPTF